MTVTSALLIFHASTLHSSLMHGNQTKSRVLESNLISFLLHQLGKLVQKKPSLKTKHMVLLRIVLCNAITVEPAVVLKLLTTVPHKLRLEIRCKWLEAILSAVGLAKRSLNYHNLQSYLNW